MKGANLNSSFSGLYGFLSAAFPEITKSLGSSNCGDVFAVFYGPEKSLMEARKTIRTEASKWPPEVREESPIMLNNVDSFYLNHSVALEIVKCSIEIEIICHQQDEDLQFYWGSTEDIMAHERIFNMLKAIGYNFEEDEEASSYFLKATQIEIYKYHLEKIVPALKQLAK